MNEFLVPGDLIRNPNAPEWGVGQVQSVVDRKITVNFQEHGKVVIDADEVALTLELENNYR
ncbi:MAG: DUF3553 domain-containing protein [Pseudomonadota bacterium]